MVTCGLCGHAFDTQAQGCPSSCPLAALQGCSLVCCPNCGYQMVDVQKSGAAALLRRLWPAAPVRKPVSLERGPD